MPRSLKRTDKYTIIANKLASMSTQQVQQVLANGKKNHQGIGGTSVHIEIENIPVFVKQIPLTNLELESENLMSTANIFNLPNYYQYGVGSAGFGAWRELAAHIITNNWVTTGKCLNFPMLYNWRIIPTSINNTDLSYWGSLDSYLTYWEHNENIKKRITCLNTANHSIVLFLEHFPKNLYQHLNDIFSMDNSKSRVVHYLKELNNSFEDLFQFMRAEGLLHMDAHFHNILADEETIYLSDFGLTLSKDFDLSNEEVKFIDNHKNYDRCSYSANLLHGILTSYVGKENWSKTLSDYLNHNLPLCLPVSIKELLEENSQIAATMHAFYQMLQKDKSTRFPSNQLNALLAAMDQRYF